MKKNVLIVGGTTGIGYDISKKFILSQYNIIVVGRKISLPKSDQINYLLFDLSKKSELKKFFKKVHKFGQMNIVIHCIGGSLGLESINYGNCLKVWNTNIGIPININDYLINKKIIDTKSLIILFSTKGVDNNSGKPLYIMSKKYLELYVQYSSQFYKKKKIFFKCIKPSIVVSTGNNWFKCKKDNLRKYNYYVKKYNKKGLEINSNQIFSKLKYIIKTKNTKRLIFEI